MTNFGTSYVTIYTILNNFRPMDANQDLKWSANLVEMILSRIHVSFLFPTHFPVGPLYFIFIFDIFSLS